MKQTACLLVLTLSACVDQEKRIQLHELPLPARQFVEQHYEKIPVSLIKKKYDFLEISYRVLFTNGDKAEFDRHGRWEDIHCKKNEVPLAILPTDLQEQLQPLLEHTRLIKVEREQERLEIKLKNGDKYIYYEKKKKLKKKKD